MGAQEPACSRPDPIVLEGFAKGQHVLLCSHSTDLCCLKWKQSLQPGGMLCEEVSRPWLSQDNTCQFGI